MMKQVASTIQPDPTREERLLKYLENPASSRRRLFVNIHCIDLYSNLYPQHTEKLINFLFNHPEEFERLIPSVMALDLAVKAFPQYSGRFFNHIFNDEEEFKRIISKPWELSEALENFPQHHKIFSKSTREEALLAAKNLASEMEIRKNARVIAQGSRLDSPQCFFQAIPNELQLKIAALTRNPAIHDEKQAQEIASANLCQPQ